eukprot:11584768-Alexandrium_andersonii.AAC.1
MGHASGVLWAGVALVASAAVGAAGARQQPSVFFPAPPHQQPGPAQACPGLVLTRRCLCRE